MSGISTGVGLISGINSADIIDQLMQIEARPRQLVEQRVEVLTAQKTAFMDVNARLLALKMSAGSFLDSSAFGARSATSSNPSVMTATASTTASPGSYNLTVNRLVSSHQMISRGFGDADTTTLGPGTLTFESAQGKLTRSVELSQLNGLSGIERGRIRITDRSGASADVDLTQAVTLDDVLDAINNASGINVTASVAGDSLKIVDNTGQTSSNLIVANLGTKQTATSLGIVGNSSGTDELVGTQINALSNDYRLSLLNDGGGVRTASGNDLSITGHDGVTFEVDVSDSTRISDVITAINDAAGAAGSTVTAAIGDDGVGFKLVDSTAYSGTDFTVSAGGASTAAADLGLTVNDTDHDGRINGQRVLATMGSVLLKSLNGGAGISAGSIQITDRSGASDTIDLSGATTISEVVELINASAAGVEASVNDAGNGLQISDTSGGSGDLVIADVGPETTATDLNIAGTFDTTTAADSGSLQVAYVTSATALDDFNNGQGVARGSFYITDSNGVRATIDLSQGNETTIQHVIDEINSRPTDVVASINSKGDGILLTDTGGGALAMQVTEAGSTTASDLNLLGTASGTAGDNYIDGSLERTVSIEADDTLEDVIDAINSASVGVSATLINDGTLGSPYRISLTSENTGRRGEVLLDDGGLNLGAQTVVDASDAVVFFGSSDPAEAVVLTSDTNSLSDTIEGVTIDLTGTSSESVQLSIARDNEAIVKAVKGFVEKFNAVLKRIDELDSYNVDTEERGLLLGDNTLAATARSLYNTITQKYEDVDGQYQYLSQVGLTIGNGARLQFDESTFREALAARPDDVAKLFTLETTETNQDEQISENVTIPGSGTTVTAAGLGASVEQLLEGLTDNIDGRYTLKANNIDTQIKLANSRIDQLNDLLDAKRARLEAQFTAMETALAQLQAQQSSLGSLASIANQSAG